MHKLEHVKAKEQDLLRQMYGSFSTTDIVPGDAYFGTYFLLTELLSRNIDGVFEQMSARKGNCDFTLGEKLGARDHIVTLKNFQKNQIGWMLKIMKGHLKQ